MLIIIQDMFRYFLQYGMVGIPLVQFKGEAGEMVLIALKVYTRGHEAGFG